MKKYYKQILLVLPVLAFTTFTSLSFPSKKAAPPKLILEKISVKHLDWDQLNVQFEVINTDDGTGIIPEQTLVRVFNSKGKVIAQSYGKRVLLNDASLGSEENIKVEIEVIAEGNKLTHTETLKSSKKQINFNPLIIYPLKKQLYAGAYSINPKFYRVKFGTQNEYEVLDVDTKDIQYFLAINDENSSKKIALQVKEGNAKFKLSESPQYEDFKPVLEAALAETGGAILKFSFVGLWNDKYFEGEATDVSLAFSGTSNHKIDQPKVYFEKQSAGSSTNTIALGSFAELQKHARTYASKLSETYRVIPESLHVQINQWKYDVVTNFYQAEIAIQWKNTFADEEKYAVKGTLIVDKEGKRPEFQRSYANQTILDVEKFSKTERAMASVR